MSARPGQLNHKWSGGKHGLQGDRTCRRCGLMRRGTFGTWAYLVAGQWVKQAKTPPCVLPAAAAAAGGGR